MKKVLTIVLAIVLTVTCAFGVAGCEKKTTDVVFLYNGPVEFFQQLSDGFKAKFESEGYTYESANAGFNSSTQNDQIENYTTKGVKTMILMAVDGNASKDAAGAAVKAGVDVIAFTVYLAEGSQTLYMGSNDVEIGKTVAEIGFEWEKYKSASYTADEILVIGNSSNDASIERSNSIVKNAEEFFGVTLPASNKKMDWSKDTAEVTTAFQNYWTSLGNGTKPKVILCYNSDMALGVDAVLTSDAIKSTINLDEMCVVGSDAGSIVGKIMGPMEATSIRGIASLDGVEGIVEEVWGFASLLLTDKPCPSESLALPFILAGSWYQK